MQETVDYFIDDNTRQQMESSNFIFKKTAHAYFEHRFFGGKIRRIWTDITYRTNNEKIVLLSWRENCNFF